MSIDKALSELVRHFRGVYAEDPTWEMTHPVYYLLDKTGTSVAICPVMVPKNLWEEVRDVIAAKAQELEATSYLWVCEGYTNARIMKEIVDQPEKFKLDEMNMPLIGDLSEESDSVEVLQIMAGTKDGRRIHAHFAFDRAATTPEGILREVMRVDTDDDGVRIFNRFDLWPVHNPTPTTVTIH